MVRGTVSEIGCFRMWMKRCMHHFTYSECLKVLRSLPCPWSHHARLWRWRSYQNVTKWLAWSQCSGKAKEKTKLFLYVKEFKMLCKWYYMLHYTSAIHSRTSLLFFANARNDWHFLEFILHTDDKDTNNHACLPLLWKISNSAIFIDKTFITVFKQLPQKIPSPPTIPT